MTIFKDLLDEAKKKTGLTKEQQDYVSLLTSLCIPMEQIANKLDSVTKDSRQRFKLKMSYLQLITDTLGVRKDMTTEALKDLL